jgi:tripartite-type tricarboxylate transporter receptor subunit TctC
VKKCVSRAKYLLVTLNIKKEAVVMKNITKLAVSIVFFVILCIVGLPVYAADYPTKPITLIVTTSPGGAGDLYARAFANAAEKLLGKPIVVANKPGASGQIAWSTCLQAPADGYTLSMFSIFEFVSTEWEIANGRKPLANGMNDFTLIGSFGQAPYVIAVPYDSPWKNLGDLVRDAKAKPGQYVMGTGGMYSSQHIAGELFSRAAGIKFRHVPYQGGGPLTTALVGNHAHWGVTTSAGSVISLMQGKKVRILAIFGDKRYEPIRDVPTVKELGYNVELYGYVGVLARKETPAPILDKLTEVFKKVNEDEQFISSMTKAGEKTAYLSGEQTMGHIKHDLQPVMELFKQMVAEDKK